MPTIDPGDDAKALDAASKKLLARMKENDRALDEFNRQAKKDATLRRRLSADLEKEVRTGRVKAETLGGRGTTTTPESAARSKSSEARAASDVQKSTRQTALNEEKIAKARTASSRTLSADLATLRRYGDYAGSRSLAKGGASPAQIAMAQRLAAGGIGFGPGQFGGGGGGQRAITQIAESQRTVYGAGAQPLQQRGAPIVIPQSDAQKVAQRLGEVDAANQKVTKSTTQMTSAFSRSIAAQSAWDTSMRRHGALTTEFISAAARGTVTLREMGFQVGSTIGKFGGWLAAGSAVFGALAAVNALGRGAIESASGVNQLDRVLTQDLNPDALTEDFRELSKEFNLPIAEVTAATYGMAKVFQTQEGAVEGARAALFAVKVGELDTATATRYLTAILNGWGQENVSLLGTMDQLNEAQNRFGVSIPDTAAGLAKASGTFRAAGGDINSLIALITTAQKVTGQTGEVVGTALARSPNFLRREDSRGVLASFGINASDDIDRIIEQAFKISGDLGGEKLQVLASAIFGPQYGARIGTPLLQAADKYREALRKTSPQAAQGSAQRELDTLLGSIQERLSAIVTSLEQMGSNLADAGILAPLDLALRALQGILDAANGLLEIFNDLPRPLRFAVTALLQMYATVRLLRRFQLGASFQEGSLGRQLFTPPDQNVRIYKEGLFQQLAHTESELEQVSKRRAALISQQDLAQRELPRRTGTLFDAADSPGATMDDIARQEQAVASTRANIARLQEEAVQATIEEKDLMARRQSVLQQQALLQRGITDKQIAAVYGTDPNQALGRAVSDPNRALYDFAKIDPTTLDDEQLRRQALAVDALHREATSFNSRVRRFASQGGIVGRTFGVGAVATARLGTGLARVGSTMGGFFRSLAGSIGPLDLILATVIGGLAISEDIKQRTAKTAEIGDLIGQTFRNLDEARAAQKAYREARGEANETSLGENIIGVSADVQNFLNPFGDHAEDPRDTQDQFAHAAQVENKRVRESIKRAAQGLARGQRIQGVFLDFVFPDAVSKGLDNAVARFVDGTDSVKEFNRKTDNLIQNVKDAQNLTRRRQTELISNIRVARIDARGFGGDYAELAQLTAEDQQNLLESYAGIISTGEDARGELNDFLRIGVNNIADTVGKRGVEARSQAIESADTLTDNLKERAEGELERALVFAKSQRERDDAWETYIDALSPKVVGRAVKAERQDVLSRLKTTSQAQKELLRQREQVERRLRRAQEEAGTGPGTGDPLGLADPAAPGFFDVESDDVKKAEREADRLARERKRITNQLRDRRKDEKNLRQKLEDIQATEKLMKERLKFIRAEAERENFERLSAEIESVSGLAAARAPEGIERLRAQMSGINDQLKLAIDTFGRDSNEVRDLLAERAGLNDELFQYATDRISAGFDYRLAGVDSEDEVGRARIELEKAQALAARASKQGDPLAVLEAAVEVRTAEQALADAIEQRADAIQAARFELARARAGDNEVKLARIDLREARYGLRTADTLEERLTARADLINGKRDLQTARAEREIEDVEFAADIGKLSLEAQIKEYRKILRTMTLTRDLRRDLRRRIYDLKQQLDGETEGFDLAVGDIKLPTIYEIRRAIQGGGVNQQNPVTINQNNRYEINGATDPQAVADKIGGQQQDAARKNRNAMRSAGLR